MVDDDVRNLRVLKGILAPLEYDLREATNGEEQEDTGNEQENDSTEGASIKG